MTNSEIQVKEIYEYIDYCSEAALISVYKRLSGGAIKATETMAAEICDYIEHCSEADLNQLYCKIFLKAI
jgi:hypothetical protein